MFTTYIIQRNFQATRCTDSSIIPSALRWVLKRQDPHAPPPPTILLCLSAHTWANLSINICASAIFLLWPVIQKCGEGGKCRKRKSSAVLLLALDYTISFWFGLAVCVYAFSSIRQLKILRARTIGGPFLHTCIIFGDYVCTHIGSITTTRLIEDDVSC